MNIELNIGSNTVSSKKNQASALHILVLGNFSGKGESGAGTDAQDGIRNMFTFDPSQFDLAVSRVTPRISLTLGSNIAEIEMTSIDHFHPDALLAQDSLFEPEAATTPEPAQSTPKAPESAAQEENDFARLLGGATSTPDVPNTAVKSALDKLIADAVTTEPAAPVSSGPDEKRVGDMAAQLRRILQAPAFQQLESTWRSLQWLGERVDYDESASLWLVDLDIDAIETWSEELIQKVASGPGSAAALVVLKDFSDTQADISDLNRLSDLAGKLDSIAFAGAGSAMAGLDGPLDKAVALDASDFLKPRVSLGSSSTLSRLVLGFPNVLLRQPYGKRSDPIDAFDFDELGAAPADSAFLWGSASVVLAFMSVSGSLIVDEAPLVTYDDGSGQAIKPPTGAYMTDSAADALLARGIIPLLAKRGGTDIRAPRLQSIAMTSIER